MSVIGSHLNYTLVQAEIIMQSKKKKTKLTKGQSPWSFHPRV